MIAKLKTNALFTFVAAAVFSTIGLVAETACDSVADAPEEKQVIYQVFTRLFGNQNENNKPWGTIEENGVGKFGDFTESALEGIKELGVTHVWYTGVLHHAVITDYTEYDIGLDDPDVVKGRAGSPYAVKDYYQVDPDLAVDPSQRMEEFEALIERTHQCGLKVLIDIIPNHVARGYEGLNNPEGVSDFGANDDTSVDYARDNNFYYIPGSTFEVPDLPADITPLGGQEHPLSDGKFEEVPAKWTGNGSRKAKPDANDWYETVKINYGVRADGTYDFPVLPEGFAKKCVKAHYSFWQDKDVPDSWIKFRDIVDFWLDKGVDGFRFDMAEMVPVEFWSFLNSSIKHKAPDTMLVAEVYQPHLYRDYIHLGKMDYLYDKVDLYDSLKAILRGEESPLKVAKVQEAIADIEHNMLHFLENHDEQRIASPGFAGDPFKGFPLMVLSATISSSPTMLYFAQDVGEDGSETGGFGQPTRTSIFDYVGVPSHQRWMNQGAFDGGKLTIEEKKLRKLYVQLGQLTRKNPAFMGTYQELYRYNVAHSEDFPSETVFPFVRENGNDRVLVVVNFSDQPTSSFSLKLPLHDLKSCKSNVTCESFQTLMGQGSFEVTNVGDDTVELKVSLQASDSLVIKF